MKDAFRITGGVPIVPPALRDVLVQFDLGQTQLFEMPIHAGENVNPHAPEDTVIVELSNKIELPIYPGRSESKPDAKYQPMDKSEVLAVRADAAQGAHLWHDPKVSIRFFMSDRLKAAIDAAGLKVKALDLYPARVFEEG